MSNKNNTIEETKKAKSEYAEYLKHYAAVEKRADDFYFYDDKSDTYRKAESSDEVSRLWDECSSEMPRSLGFYIKEDNEKK